MTESLTATVGLTELFELQDEVLRRNLLRPDCLPTADALSSIISVCYEALKKMKFSAEKQTVIRLFATDALSHVITAARVGLWGAFPESLSVLRGAVESSAQLAFVVAQSKYGTVIEEANRGNFQEFSFRQACKKSGVRGERLMNLHNRFSSSFSHSTARRFKQLGYEFEGQTYDRLGSAAYPIAAQACTHYCLLISAEVVRCLMEAYIQDGQVFPSGEDVGLLLEFVASLPAIKESTKDRDGHGTHGN